MLRLWLALAMVAQLGGDAFALRLRATLPCGDDGVSLPRNGATSVPTNARVWRLYRNLAPTGRWLRDLQPNTTYDLSDSYHVIFTTGDGPDLDAPAQPRIGAITIAVSGEVGRAGAEVQSFFISGAYDADVAVLRVVLVQARHVVTYYMSADEPAIDKPGFSLDPGNVHVEITAIDLAGNESPPAAFEASAMLVEKFESSCLRPQRGTGRYHGRAIDDWTGRHDDWLDGVPGAVVIAPFLIDLIVLLLVGIMAGRAANKRARVSVDELAMTAAEYLARSIRRRSTPILAGTALVAAVVARAPRNAAVALVVLAPVLLYLVFLEIGSWWTAGRALRLATRDGATASVRYDEVEVMAGTRRLVMRTSPWLVDRARRLALPKATL